MKISEIRLTRFVQLFVLQLGLTSCVIKLSTENIAAYQIVLKTQYE